MFFVPVTLYPNFFKSCSLGVVKRVKSKTFCEFDDNLGGEFSTAFLFQLGPEPGVRGG
jgi:hypothetical protein